VLVDQAIYVKGERTEGHDPLGTDGFAWIGLSEATRDEIVDFQDHFHFDELALEDALNTEQRPKLEQFHGHNLLIMKTVRTVDDPSAFEMGQLAVFFSDQTVLTVRHGPVMPLATIRADLESQPERLALGPSAVVHELLDRIVDQYVAVTSRIADDVRTIEDAVFDDDVPASLQQMYSVKRELIYFRRAIQPLVDPLGQLVSGNVPFVNPALRFKFSDARDHLLRTIDEVEAMDRIVDAAIQANSALISLQQNSDMRKISAWVGIAAVPTMVAGIYGMNFDHMPELGTRYGYGVVVLAMGAACFGLFRVFRRNGWL